MAQSINKVTRSLVNSYNEKTSNKFKFLDCFLAYLCISGVLDFSYGLLINNDPYNSFLSSFISKVGQFVLTVNLRIQSNTENTEEFVGVSPERAFADYVFASLILHFCVLSFLG